MLFNGQHKTSIKDVIARNCYEVINYSARSGSKDQRIVRVLAIGPHRMSTVRTHARLSSTGYATMGGARVWRESIDSWVKKAFPHESRDKQD